MKIYFCIFPFLLFTSCGEKNQSSPHSIGDTIISIDTLAVIGTEDQPFEYQLGEPLGVLTDSNGNIYIADRASLTVKVFSPEGELLRSFAGRGRGPGEFQWVNMMSQVGEDTLVFQDRGQLQFIYTDLQGELISSHPVDISSQMTQYFPASIKWYNGHSIGLMQHSASNEFEPSQLERPLFYVYDKEFQMRKSTFFPFNEMDYSENDMFIWTSFIPFPGSFDLSTERETLIYSPGVYTGKLYELTPSDSLTWETNRIISAHPAHSPAYEIYHSEAQYESMQEIPGVNNINFFGGPYHGRLYSISAGVFYLSNGNIAHFYGEWQGGDKTLKEGNPLVLFAQIINPEGKIIEHSRIMSVERDTRPSVSLVNWKDKQDNFYLLNLSKHEVPTVIKFRLNLNGI